MLPTYLQVSWNCTVPWALVLPLVMSAESTPCSGHLVFFKNNTADWLYFHFFFYSQFSFIPIGEKKKKMLLLQGIHQLLFLYSSPEVTIISTATNCDVSRRIDFCLFICSPTHGWIGYRPISFPLPFSSHRFNADDFNEAPFSICSTETIHNKSLQI